MAKRKTHEEFIREVHNLIGDEYDILGNYVNNSTKILIRHNECSHQYETRPNSLLQGGRCPKCNVQKQTINKFKDEIYHLVNDEYSIIGGYINNTSKVLLRHNECGHEYIISRHKFISGRRCPNCFGNKKKTTSEFKKQVYNLVKDDYEVLGEYKGAKTKLLMRHNCCGFEYMVTPTNFLSNKRCPKCFVGIKKTTKQFKMDVYKATNNEYTVLGEYIDTDTEILMKHNCCETEYLIKPKQFVAGVRCPNCCKTKLKTTNEFKNQVYNLVNDEYNVLGNYINSKTKIKIIHNTCNNQYEVRPSNFLRGDRCPHCYGNIKKTNSQFKKEVFDLVGDEYDFIESYINADVKLLVKHNKCNNFYKVCPDKFLNEGTRCPNCSNSKGFSQGEKELLDYITSILPIETEIISNDRTVLKPKELDIYIPNLNIAFEYNGLYWHTEEYIDKNYHLDKMIECNKKGIKLIHIFEDEWLNNQELMKNKIANLLGVNNNNKVYARKCYVKEVEDNQVKNNFLNENHIQGKDNSKFSYGLYTKDKDNLVAILTLCKPRVNMGMKNTDNNLYELSRYATNCNVIGGMGKILKYIKLNNQEVNKIYTYADLRFTDKEDNVYLKNGFKFVSQSRPNYWYFVSGERKSRFNYQKGNLKKLFPDVYDDNLSEKEIMEIMGYYRIYDCGNLKYEIDMK